MVCANIVQLPAQWQQKAEYDELLGMDFDQKTLDNPILESYLALSNRKDPDTLRYHEAIVDSDWEGFKQAMKKEIASLEEFGTWDIIPRNKATKKVFPSTWAFCHKRFPDGSVNKLKARFCVRGDKQVAGVDYFDTYTLVVSWSIVHLLLVTAIIFDLSSVQVDYVNAFAQGDLEEDIFVDMPKGFTVAGADNAFVLKLRKSLYGLVQSPRNFFKKLSKALIERGFVQSKIDPCLFIQPTMLCLVYVDDCIFFAKIKNNIDLMIADLKKEFKLEVGGDVSAFLGV